MYIENFDQEIFFCKIKRNLDSKTNFSSFQNSILYKILKLKNFLKSINYQNCPFTWIFSILNIFFKFIINITDSLLFSLIILIFFRHFFKLKNSQFFSAEKLYLEFFWIFKFIFEENFSYKIQFFKSWNMSVIDLLI